MRSSCRDQRNDVLARDLTVSTYTQTDPGCTAATGRLADVYTGRSIDFARRTATSAAVQNDHLVPLGWDWQHGAPWTGERREQLATDFTGLQAVNEAQSDQGPATWLLPAAGCDCFRVTRFAYVLHAYAITIDDDDRAASDRTLDTWSRHLEGTSA